MSGDYETLEVNQPKISYFQKNSVNNTEWLDKLINEIEEKCLNQNDSNIFIYFLILLYSIKLSINYYY